MGRLLPGLVLCLSFLLSPAARGGSVTTLYSTQFETAEGYDLNYELVGQNGWLCYPDSYGGNGLLTNAVGGQSAYIGYFPLDPLTNYFNVWHPIEYPPGLTNPPVVHFSVDLTIVDSTQTNGNRDSFYWSFYNSDAHELFTIAFDNYDLKVYYGLDKTNDLTATGLTFTNDVSYPLSVTLELGANRWSATLGGALLATNRPITSVGALTNIADIDAVWTIYDALHPGDNFMVFDNYTVSAETTSPAPARLAALGFTTRGEFLLRLSGTSGAHYAIETTTNWTQWTALKTNVLSDGSFEYLDTSASGAPARFYRARLVP